MKRENVSSKETRASAMLRSILVCLVPISLLLVVSPIPAQQFKKIPRIGVLTPDPISARANQFQAFNEGLRELGYVKGKNIAIEIRSAEGKRDRLDGLATGLVSLKADVIVTTTTPAIQVLKRATSTIPIVTISGDPVGTGLVHSLARPGGNITGLALLHPEISGKKLELLKEIVPKVKQVAFVWDPANPSTALGFKEAKIAARAMGLEIQSVEVRSANELENVLESTTSEHSGALSVSIAMANAYRSEILDFAAKNRLPVVYEERQSVEDGGLMSYGPSITDLFRRAATYVDKVLKGAKPAELPIELPMKFELVINLKTAKQIGLTIPPNVLARADRVIR